MKTVKTFLFVLIAGAWLAVIGYARAQECNAPAPFTEAQEAFVEQQVRDLFPKVALERIAVRALSRGGGVTYAGVRIDPRVAGFGRFFVLLDGERTSHPCILSAYVIENGHEQAQFHAGRVGRCR